MSAYEWPWYEVVADDSIDQGDIVENCQVLDAIEGDGGGTVAKLRYGTMVVMTQTCDLAQNKIGSVVVCAVWSVARLVLEEPTLLQETKQTAAAKKLSLPNAYSFSEEARINDVIGQSKQLRKEFNAVMKGERPHFAMLESHPLTPVLPKSIVNFRQVYSVPLNAIARFANRSTPRLRLLPPYREHLSQAFARFFARIGLPKDIERYQV